MKRILTFESISSMIALDDCRINCACNNVLLKTNFVFIHFGLKYYRLCLDNMLQTNELFMIKVTLCNLHVSNVQLKDGYSLTPFVLTFESFYHAEPPG